MYSVLRVIMRLLHRVKNQTSQSDSNFETFCQLEDVTSRYPLTSIVGAFLIPLVVHFWAPNLPP